MTIDTGSPLTSPPTDQGVLAGHTDHTGIVPASGAVEPDFDIDDGAEPRRQPTGAGGAKPAVPVVRPLPVVPPTPDARVEADPDRLKVLMERITALTTEARAVASGNTVAAAPLWFGAGRLYEHELANHREAAVHYQEAHRADPSFLPVIHAARRLFGQLGKWGMVVMLLDEELRLPGAPVSSLLVEKARIHESKLARPEDAITLYRQVLSHEPDNPIAVDAVARALSARGAFVDVADVVLAAAAATTRPNLRVAWLLDAARVCETRLSDDVRALALVEQADALIPNRPAVLQMLRRLAARSGDVARLEDVLEKLADLASNAVEAVAFLTEKASVAAASEAPEGLRRAVAALEEARARAPHDAAVLSELCRIYERLDMSSSLADCLEARALSASDRRDRQAFSSDAARIAEERLGETERAIRLYRACVEMDPSDQSAMSALGRLFFKARRFDELSHIYDVQLESTTDPQLKIPLLFKHAELLASSMDDVDSALSRLREILLLSPGYVPASKMAAALYIKLERHHDLVEVWESELKHNVDRDQGLYLLEKIAAVCEEKLGDTARAIDAYQRMLALQSGHLPTLRNLGRLYALEGRWDDLIKVNLEEAQTVSDQNVVVSLWFRNGEVLADKLGRVDDAIESFNRALQLMPTYLPALKALGGIYARAGRFNDLVAMHRAEAEVVRRAEQRAHLLYIAAEILETKVGDAMAATKGYHEVLAEDPSHHPALRALKRIASRRGDSAMVLEVMQGELRVVADAMERGQLRCAMAELLERRLGRVDDAVIVLEEAITDAPGLLFAHEMLVSLLSRYNRASAEAAARERMQASLVDAYGRLANLRTIGELYLHRLDDPARALNALQRVLELIPNDRPALRGCLGCALRLRDYPAAIAAAGALALVEPSADEVCNLTLQMASWREGHAEPPQDSLPDYVRILEFQPEHPIALRALERLYVERRAWGPLYALYEREGSALVDPVLIVDNAMQMGELAENRLDQLDVARACYERAHAAKPDFLPAITRLKEIYGTQGRPQDQLRLLTLEAQTSKDPAHAVRTLLEVGALQRDQFGDIAAAVECFARVLDRAPLHTEAYPALESLLVGSNRWSDLARLYERRADAITADAVSQPQRLELLSRAAHLAGERFHDPNEATRLYGRIVQIVPQHTGALLQLGNLAFANADWDNALASWGALLPVEADPMLLVSVHFNLGIIFTEHRPDAARAIQHLTAGLAMQPENRVARKQLARAFALSGSPAQALQAYRQLVDTALDVDERRELHLILARLHSTALPDPRQVITHLEAALQLTADVGEQAGLLAELTGTYERSGNHQGVFDATNRQAEGLVATQPRRAAELHFRNARLALEQLGTVDVALKSAKRALELAKDATEIRGFIADIYSRTPSQHAQAVEEHRRVLRAGRVRLPSLKALFRGFSQQRVHDGAFCVAELLSFLAASDDGEELFFGDNKKRVKKESTVELDVGQVTSLVAHPSQRNVVREILAAVAVDLAKPLAATDLEVLDKKLVLRPKAADPLRTLADNMAQNLGVTGFDVWRSQVKKSGVDAIVAVPLVLLVGGDVTRTHPNREQRFLIGRGLMAFASGHHLLRGVDGRGLATLLSAVGRSIDKAFPLLGQVDAGEVDALVKRVGGAISRKVKGQLTEPLARLAAAPRVDFDAYMAAVPLSENRAGLLLAGAFDAAARLVARDTGVTLAGDTNAMIAALESNPRLVDLVAFSLSEEHFQARQALKLAIDA